MSSDDGSWLALRCASDADCGPGGRCAAADDDDPHFRGGPAGGYCTKACRSDADCGPGNTCKDAEDGGVCLLGCTPAEPRLTHIDDELDPDKCHGREDLGCLPSSGDASRGACVPVCGSDAQCPGRRCDPLLSVCVDTPSAGRPAGAPCPGTGEECAGVCLRDTEGNSQCTSRCVLGGELFSTSDCGGLEQGICIISLSSSGVGDVGACAIACQQHDDCQNPFLWCKSTPVTDHGFCIPAEPCPGSDVECPAGSECTETAHGPYCIDGRIPLGDAAPGAGGEAGAGGGAGAGGEAGTGGAAGAP
ncbi:uncharacterized protein SOCEGT47_020760 [Sorangium cellulosum]|uniref:Uncharacterized protein n=1 Tax=Sorangium cellulosum TaxID=56 RepID=A0A4P2PXV3_SORCE|nr:hypothetical protein [Sorangium cellulosum]AUX21590.1 uncharacterized protein SOCEGT47_020760 [Sorangium cellulosum]